ncbi:hypothetical protein H5410_039250 [Solanum commersonii]|uniref:Replication protein A 70 kDa DNA-binding subunit B/D first OB fold domain-containing protein n=1 Tax=Solanum commersonii TaxID=4109 RepID=A0A9J5YCU9_SOLCO|nr:hypothetical protein H5410_039250 [Solanum commersonii]
MAYSFLSKLCYAIIPNKNGELISIEMIFVDEKGNLMHGIVRKNQVNRFKGKLSEGSSFIIKNLKVVESIDIVDIPKNGIHFIKPYMIDSRVNNNSVLSSRYLYDVVGWLNGIGDMESAGSNWEKRKIYIVTKYSAKSKITLWDELGEKFAPYLYNKDAGPYIVIVTTTTVKEFCILPIQLVLEAIRTYRVEVFPIIYFAATLNTEFRKWNTLIS